MEFNTIPSIWGVTMLLTQILDVLVTAYIA
jgi:hypothetical protein